LWRSLEVPVAKRDGQCLRHPRRVDPLRHSNG
jgi:hypothetical protein